MFRSTPFATTTRVYPPHPLARASTKGITFQSCDSGVVPEGEGTDQLGDRARVEATQRFASATEFADVTRVTVTLYAPWWRRRLRHPLTFRYVVEGATYREASE